MSFSYERYDTRQRSRQRSTFGYWVPLVVTVTIAAGGLAAWVWSSRDDDSSSSSSDDDLSYGEDHTGHHGKKQYTGGETSSHGVTMTSNTSFEAREQGHQQQEESFVAKMSGAIRRTPSPQKMFDIAGKRVAAGVAAAGAMVGGALGSIREEKADDFADHSRWNEEALQRNTTAQSAQSQGAVAAHAEGFMASARETTTSSGKSGAKRKTVAVVLSAEGTDGGAGRRDDGEYHMEHAVSCL
jgi:hypothetical protein